MYYLYIIDVGIDVTEAFLRQEIHNIKKENYENWWCTINPLLL